MIETQQILFNGKWPLVLPQHRAEWPPLTTPPYWEPERLDHMHEHIEPGDVIYDIGAEEGDISGLIASWGADVVLFEPNPKVWPNMRATFEANNLGAPLGCYVGFAGAFQRAGKQLDDAIDAAWAGWPDCADGAVISDHGFCNVNERPDIPCITIDRFADELDDGDDGFSVIPNGLTIDVEGAEMLVLMGAAETMQAYGPKIWLSSHPTFQREMYGYEEAGLLDYLDYLGYRYELIAEDHERHFFAEPK